MGQSTPINVAGHAYDVQTIDLLRNVLDDVWSVLTESQRNQLPRSMIAELLLSAAAAGERDEAALRIHVLAKLGCTDVAPSVVPPGS